MEAVKGLQGTWHYTNGSWHDEGTLQTLCGRGVSPNHRRFTPSSIKVVDCPKCQAKYKAVAGEAEKKYLELNNLTKDTCNPQDKENIRFNIDYALGVRV